MTFKEQQIYYKKCKYMIKNYKYMIDNHKCIIKKIKKDLRIYWNSITKCLYKFLWKSNIIVKIKISETKKTKEIFTFVFKFISSEKKLKWEIKK